MALGQLSIKNFRNLAQVELKLLTQGFNFFYGKNGSGKTSFLEVIYYLGHRRSFRSLNADHLIRYSSNCFNLFGKIFDSSGQIFPLGVERIEKGECRVRILGQDIATISELAAFLPMRLMNVHSHYLLEGSPVFRRKYLDWGIFYQNKEFYPIWFRFKRLLRQRNSALKKKVALSELISWTEQLAEAAKLFHDLRISYWHQLLPLLHDILSRHFSGFFDVSDLDITYQPGWDVTVSYEEMLETVLYQDLERGTTQYGPHRADLRLRFKKIPAKEALSTGQQKLLVCGMILAQGALLGKQVNKKPIYLIDDLPSELDIDSRQRFISILAEQQTQIFVTAVEEDALSGIFAQINSPVKMFHVKQGAIIEE